MKLGNSIIFYVGNGSVKGSFVNYSENQIPKILSTRSRTVKNKFINNRAELESAILNELDTLLQEMKLQDFPKLNKGCRKFDNALFLMATPWYTSQTNTFKAKEEKPFKVTEKLLQGMARQLVKPYTNNSEIQILEQKILSVNLNGYAIEDPIGKTVNELDMHIYTSFIKGSSAEKIQDLIHKHFAVKKVDIHSQTLISHCVINDIWPDLSNYVIVDVTSKITELNIVRNGNLCEAGTFPIGKDIIITKLSEQLATSREVSESLLSLYQANSIEEDQRAKVDSTLLLAKKEWLAGLSDLLKRMSSGISIPKDIVVVTPNYVLSIFANFIKDEEYQQYSYTDGKFNILKIEKDLFKNLCLSEAGVSDEISIFVGALFNQKIHSDSLL